MAIVANEKSLDRLAYSVTEVTEITGLGRTTIYRLINEQRLQSVKVGRRRLIKADDLSSLLGTDDKQRI